ncbi:hypothetical protein V5799_019254 [Amblyomma americanum]|uniref:RING-type E3 ubiquitin transferase n=1 Tax=Amblyomma americanum TaxID=6943 RepID=A0AAQ4EX21_AMBAM
MPLDWLTQYLTLENVCLGVNVVTLSVIYKAYRNKVTNFEAVQTARQFDIDQHLASKLREEYPDGTAVHAVIRGHVKALGDTIKSRHMRHAKAVIQECCLTEHKIQWSPVSRFWSQTQREIQRILNFVPFGLVSRHSNVMVEVVDPLECENVPVNCVYENFIPNREGLSGVFFGWLRGEQTKGIEEQEFLLEEGSALTAFGTLTVAEDASWRHRQRPQHSRLTFRCQFPKMSSTGNSAVTPPVKTEDVKPGTQDASKACRDQVTKAQQGAEAKGTQEAARTTQPDAVVNSAKVEAAAQSRPGQNVEGDAKAVRSPSLTLPPSLDQQKSKGPEITEISYDDYEPDTLDLDFTHCRIGKLSNLENLRRIEILIFRNNLLKKIENVHMLVTLKELEFYDNQITKIENLDALVNLEILDISFNRLTHIENLDKLVKLKKLFLVNNRITKIENLDKLVNLEMLELGSNRIKVVENLGTLVNLKSLFLGKNRISKLENLEPLKQLELLSIQSNRIVKLEGLHENRNLCHLYMSHNGIEKIENLENNVKLETLDLAANRIKHLINIKHLVNIEEFWFNDNEIESFEEVQVLANFPKLATVYLHNNPIEKDPMYRRKIMMISPTVTQIDATMCRK